MSTGVIAAVSVGVVVAIQNLPHDDDVCVAPAVPTANPSGAEGRAGKSYPTK
jgi:hypothetical protein